jgi:hypothetical protein
LPAIAVEPASGHDGIRAVILPRPSTAVY